MNRGGGAAGHDADIVGEVGLGQLAAEGVEDARHLVDRAIADALAEDTARTAGAAARGQRPPDRAAAGDRAVFAALVVAGELFGAVEGRAGNRVVSTR